MRSKAVAIVSLVIIASMLYLVFVFNGIYLGTNDYVVAKFNGAGNYTYSTTSFSYVNKSLGNHTSVLKSIYDSVLGSSSKYNVIGGVTPYNYNTSMSDLELIQLSDSEAWNLLTGGAFTDYVTEPFYQVESTLHDVHSKYSKKITVPCWYWANPSDASDLTKVQSSIDLDVNVAIADMVVNIFNDIYNHPSKPVINIRDVGSWAVRAKNHNPNNRPSAHSIGAAIDINPTTGSVAVNGVQYGNGYGDTKMPTDIWNSLPEDHTKYHIMYVDSPIVQTFKAYGWYWGGEWNSTPDAQHFGYLGDGSRSRETGYQNYLDARR